MPAHEIAPRPVQLGDPPAAGSPVHHAGTDEIGTSSAEAAGRADDADRLVDVLPLAAADAHAIGEAANRPPIPRAPSPCVTPGGRRPLIADEDAAGSGREAEAKRCC